MMSTPMQWWIASAVLVALELGSGTFYVLMLAVGASAGALAAHLGATPEWQWAAASVVGMALVGLLYLLRRRRATIGNPDINLDIGSTVAVDAWSPDGTARVRYRGTDWDARLAPGASARPGRCRIVALDGNTLVLQPTQP